MSHAHIRPESRPETHPESHSHPEGHPESRPESRRESHLNGRPPERDVSGHTAGDTAGHRGGNFLEQFPTEFAGGASPRLDPHEVEKGAQGEGGHGSDCRGVRRVPAQEAPGAAPVSTSDPRLEAGPGLDLAVSNRDLEAASDAHIARQGDVAGCPRAAAVPDEVVVSIDVATAERAPRTSAAAPLSAALDELSAVAHGVGDLVPGASASRPHPPAPAPSSARKSISSFFSAGTTVFVSSRWKRKGAEKGGTQHA